jgi:hypothetical protein
VGPYNCTIDPHYSSESLLTCYTAVGIAGDYQVTVQSAPDSISPFAVATTCCYSYSAWATPTLEAVVPAAGPAGTSITIIGEPVSVLQNTDYGCDSIGAQVYTEDCLSGKSV